MKLFKQAQAKDIGEYYQQHAPIARALLKIESKLKKKFDIAYFLSKENIAFRKMSSLCSLEERHNVDLGQGTKITKHAQYSLSILPRISENSLPVYLAMLSFSVYKLMEALIQVSLPCMKHATMV